MKRMGLFNQLVLALLLAIGFGIVWGILAGITGYKVTGGGVARTGMWEELRFTRSGQAVIQTHRNDDNIYIDGGRRFVDGGVPDATESASLLQPLRLTDYRRIYHNQFSGSDWGQRLAYFTTNIDDVPVLWYLVADSRGDYYLTGYNQRTKRNVGYISRNGFSDTKPGDGDLFTCRESRTPLSLRVCSKHIFIRGAQFAIAVDYTVPAANVLMIQDEHKVYRADLKEKSLTVFYNSPEEKIISIVENEYTRRDQDKGKYSLGIRTETELIVYNEDATLAGRAAIPVELRNWETLSWYETNSGEQFITQDKMANFEAATVQRYAVTATGEVQKQEAIELRSDWSKQGDQEVLVMAAAIPSPMCWVIGVVGSAIANLYHGEAPDFMTSLRDTLRPTPMKGWISFGVIGLLSIVLSALTFQRARRYHRPLGSLILWAAFVLLFGLPGYAGYRLCQRWPVIEPCPHCSKPVPRDREACGSCGSGFPQGARKGTEIFG